MGIGAVSKITVFIGVVYLAQPRPQPLQWFKIFITTDIQAWNDLKSMKQDE